MSRYSKLNTALLMRISPNGNIFQKYKHEIQCIYLHNINTKINMPSNAGLTIHILHSNIPYFNTSFDFEKPSASKLGIVRSNCFVLDWGFCGIDILKALYLFYITDFPTPHMVIDSYSVIALDIRLFPKESI